MVSLIFLGLKLKVFQVEGSKETSHCPTNDLSVFINSRPPPATIISWYLTPVYGLDFPLHFLQFFLLILRNSNIYYRVFFQECVAHIICFTNW